MRLRKLLDWRSALIYAHRWIGIALTLVFVIWFVSGIVFVYVGMPTLPAEERLMRMEPLDLRALAVTPEEVASRAGLEDVTRVRIAMSGGRPVYRLLAGDEWRMVYADTGEPLSGLSADEALAVMRRYAPEHASSVTYDGHLTDSDQWTLQNVIRNTMPMHRVALHDEAGTEYYISEKTGEPVLRTTAQGRFWGYMSAVLHWLYFTPLRRHSQFWQQFVIWSSLIGTVMCGMGIVLGIWRYSVSRRFRLRGVPSRTPYASWMKWHHYAGLIFGFFTCTWAFSGALSLSPFDFLKTSPATPAIRDAATGGPVNLSPLTVERIRAAHERISEAFPPRELDFFQFQGKPYFIAYRPPAESEAAPWRNSGIADASSLFIDRESVKISVLRPEQGTFSGFEPERMWDVANAAMPGIAVRDSVWLNEYDNYYYSQKRQRTLPVLRVRYADPQETWRYLDPKNGVIASRLERSSRWNRWLYHGFHSLDFPFLYYRRPLWDVIVILLSVGGIAISVTSALPAWRRLVRHARPIFGRRAAGVPALQSNPRPVAAGQSLQGRAASNIQK